MQLRFQLCSSENHCSIKSLYPVLRNRKRRKVNNLSDSIKQVPSLRNTILWVQTILNCNISVMVLMALQVSGPGPNLLTPFSESKWERKKKNFLKRTAERKYPDEFMHYRSYWQKLLYDSDACLVPVLTLAGTDRITSFNWLILIYFESTTRR